jgi:hypothetical protein
MVGREQDFCRGATSLFRSLRKFLARGEIQLLLDFDAPAQPAPPPQSRRRRRPEDLNAVRELTRAHRELNATKFGGELSAIPIRVSGRMKSRLGHYTLRGQSRHRQEIVISRRHIRRHGWEEAVHTLLHEMVHQWQDETGRPVDHGPDFREKSRLVGITPRATRSVARPA